MCPPNVLCIILIHKVYQQSSNCMFCCIGRMGNGSTNQSAHDFDAPCKDKRTLTHTHARRNGNATAGLALQAQRCAPDFARAPLAEVADQLRVCFRLSKFAFCILFVEVESAMGPPAFFCMTLMHHVPQNDWIFCVSVCRSNGSCVLQTFFA